MFKALLQIKSRIWNFGFKICQEDKYLNEKKTSLKFWKKTPRFSYLNLAGLTGVNFIADLMYLSK